MFQLGHFLAEMDREIQMKDVPTYLIEFQLGHFLAEMDRYLHLDGGCQSNGVSIGPLLSRNG